MPIHCKGKMNMKKKNTKTILVALGTLAAFALWTFLIRCVDVQPIGPNGSRVGFAAINGAFHALTGVHWALYTLTDWLGLVPVAFALGFAVLGLVQLISRRSLRRVDGSILVLGAFYIAVMAAYLLFEKFAVNYRPVLIDGFLEASYPSSTTLLTLCVMPTAMLQLSRRLRSGRLRSLVLAVLAAFTAFMVVGRLLSGVHWLTDIVGGVLLSAAIVCLYAAAADRAELNQ